MRSKLFTFRGACLALCLALSSLTVAPLAGSAAAWSARGEKAQGEKPLTKKQAKALAARMVRDLMKRMFFIEDELARKVSLTLIPVGVQNKEVTDREFTDMILNNFLDYGQISLVNQEPQMGDNLSYQLMSYDDEWLTRKRGLMLGANFIVTGGILESLESDEQGRTYRVYTGALYVKDISNNRIVVEQKTELDRKKVSHKR